MPNAPSRLSRLAGAAILFLLASPAAADDPKLPPPQGQLQAVLERIRQHAAIDAWKQPGFKDDAIEAWLDKLLASIGKAAEIQDLKLPVRLKDVQPKEPQPDARGVPKLTGALVVAKNVDWKAADVTGCVILADGDVDVAIARNSVIVARGIVTIHGISAACVIAAGTLVKVGDFDGQPANPGNGSIIVSRGWADLGRRASGTIVAAHEGIVTGDTTGAIFINAPVPQPPVPPAGGRGGFVGGFGRRDTASRSIKVPDLPLEALRIHPLGEKLKVLGVLYGDAPTASTPRGAPRPPPTTISALNRGGLEPTTIIFQFEGRRYFADVGRPILDEAGDPVAALQGWKLIWLANQLAILSGPEAVTVLRMDAK